MRQFSPVVAREAQTADWLLERGGFELSSPLKPHSFRDLVAFWILRRKIRLSGEGSRSRLAVRIQLAPGSRLSVVRLSPQPPKTDALMRVWARQIGHLTLSSKIVEALPAISTWYELDRKSVV